MSDLLGSAAPPRAALNLAAQLLMGAALLAGMALARRKRFRAHAVCQSAVLLLNLIPILGYMLPVFRRAVLTEVPARLGDPFYAWPTAHAALGTAAELLGLYIVLRAGTNLLPQALRFDNYKRWMRAELALWWLVIALGCATYFSWHVAVGAQPPRTEVTPAAQRAAPAGAAEQQRPAPTPATVEMRNFAFEPRELTVAPGTTVVWKDAVGRHTVRADDGSFESDVLAVGGEFRHTFDKPGRYPFHCTLHGAPNGEEMAGVVTVAAGGGP